jgi:hypothetical protein
MKRKRSPALSEKDLHHTQDPPASANRQLRPTTRKAQGSENASENRQLKTPASQAHNDREYDQEMELDDGDDGSGGEEDTGESNKGINEANDQSTFDGAGDVEEMGNDNNFASESESESFVKTYRDYRIQIRKAACREAEKEFLLNKRGLAGLPKRRKLDEQQQKDQRFCTWALRQIKRRIKALLEEEVARGEFSSSDGLSESDEDKSWKMYGIIAEDDTGYLVAWKGVDRNTGQDHADEWTAKDNVEEKDRREWEVYKRKKANNEI